MAPVMSSFNANILLSPPLRSKFWLGSEGAVSSSKAPFECGALRCPVAVFQITSGAADIKIAFIY